MMSRSGSGQTCQALIFLKQRRGSRCDVNNKYVVIVMIEIISIIGIIV